VDPPPPSGGLKRPGTMSRDKRSALRRLDNHCALPSLFHGRPSPPLPVEWQGSSFGLVFCCTIVGQTVGGTHPRGHFSGPCSAGGPPFPLENPFPSPFSPSRRLKKTFSISRPFCLRCGVGLPHGCLLPPRFCYPPRLSRLCPTPSFFSFCCGPMGPASEGVGSAHRGSFTPRITTRRS